jgi:lysozyme family protein
MADWNTAYNWMMDNEDYPRACKQVPDAGGSGTDPVYAISGINSAAWPTQFSAIAAIPQDQRRPAVQQFYHDCIWNNWFDQVASDELCKRVFDYAVNANGVTAVKRMQQALNSLGGAQIGEDGHWGPMTLAAVNAADPGALVAAFKAKRLEHYQAIVAANPARAQFLKAWTARANK